MVDQNGGSVLGGAITNPGEAAGFPSDVFAQREKEALHRAEAVTKEIVQDEFRLLKLELLLSLTPKKECGTLNKNIKALRKKEWAKSLKKAKGDSRKAYFGYLND